MKIFLIGSAIPCRRSGKEGVTAVNIILYELLRGLASLKHKIILQLIFNTFRKTDSLSTQETEELEHLKGEGVAVLPEIYLTRYQAPTLPGFIFQKLSKVTKLLLGQVRIEDYYPSANLRKMVEERIRSMQADAVLSIWSPEGVAATYGYYQLPKIAYQGDVDFVPTSVRLEDRTLFSDSKPPLKEGGINQVYQKVIEKLWDWRRCLDLIGFRRAHLALMDDVDIIANVTASNAEFYRNHGHRRSIYVGNTWSDLYSKKSDSTFEYKPNSSSVHHIKIIGHMGYLNSTGSTYGLRFLLKDVLPYLNEKIKTLDYQIHIIGGGEAEPSLRPYLNQEHVILRGFIEDLDSELKSSDIFLLLNNAGMYQAAFTRHIVAWSMGLCLIAHTNSQKAIPEINHMENALLGSTPEQVAEMIFLAATNPDINLRIRKGGRATYEKCFKPSKVAERLSAEIEQCRKERSDLRR